MMTRVVALAAAACLAGCAGLRPDTGQAFTISDSDVTFAEGCMGSSDTHYSDGSVIHEDIVCAGRYSEATCTPWRTVPGASLIARCRFAYILGPRSRPFTRYFGCDNPREDIVACSGELSWKDLGSSPPGPRRR